ncbi:MAG: hypothetical protein LBM78_02345 [Clostridiales bacterium]|jgi:hypothetical protein|nr:hypothetical protein [Clostridiales bacterium]
MNNGRYKKIGTASRPRRMTALIISLAAVCLLTLGVGFASLSRSLTINGRAEIKARPDVEITKAAIHQNMGLENGSSELYSPSYTDTTLTVGAQMPYPYGGNLSQSGYILNVTIKNNSTVPVYLMSIDRVSFSNTQYVTLTTTGGDLTTYTAQNAAHSKLNPGESKIVLLQFMRKSSPVPSSNAGTRLEATLFFNFSANP